MFKKIAYIFLFFSCFALAQNQASFEIENLNVNDGYSNFGTSYYGDDIIFSSAKSRGVTSWVNPKDKEVFYNLYRGKVSPSKSATLEEIKRFRPTFLSNFHQSTLVFTQDLKEVYITQSNQSRGAFVEGSKGVVSLKVYKFVQDESGKWSEMIDLPFNSDDYSVAHPTLSADGKFLIVASNRDDSLGETDLYSIEILEDGQYGPMKNLGPLVNSKHRETFPFIGDNGLLYYSSDRPGGMGGLDIYASNQVQGYFMEPVSLEFPINSPSDDFSFIINSSENNGYFSSNRAGGKGGDDIYSFNQVEALAFDCKQILEGTLIDFESKDNLSDLSVVLLDEFGNAMQSSISDQDGKFAFAVDCGRNYTILVNEFGFHKKELALETTGNPSERQNYQIDLTKDVIVKNEKEQINLNPIYFEVNSSYLTESAKLELEKVFEVMEKYPEMEIAIGSHTDSRDDANYNLWLSDRRARRTMDYLVNLGIQETRLQAKGFGESELLNACKDGVECSDDQHAENRRSEFVIIKE